MSIDNLFQNFPDYAKDLKLNLSSLLSEETLTPQQLWGTALASALASRNTDVIKAIGAQATNHLSPDAVNAAKLAASLMAMNNIYYRFVHLAQNEEYGKMPARLRMNGIARPGVDKVDFELWCFAVSVINGCGMCIDSHERTLREHNVTKEVIQTTARIASVMHAAAATLDGEVAFPSEAAAA